METKPIGLYVHIPFCVRKCNYCDFASEALSVSKREKYIDSLLSEIESYKDENISVDTVFFGGGTPTSLDASELLKIIEKIKKCFFHCTHKKVIVKNFLYSMLIHQEKRLLWQNFNTE